MAVLKLHYRTLGTPVRDATGKVTNAVLLLHGTTGTADTMLAPGYEQAFTARASRSMPRSASS